jgi:hypothetical protein
MLVEANAENICFEIDTKSFMFALYGGEKTCSVYFEDVSVNENCIKKYAIQGLLYHQGWTVYSKQYELIFNVNPHH